MQARHMLIGGAIAVAAAWGAGEWFPVSAAETAGPSAKPETEGTRAEQRSERGGGTGVQASRGDWKSIRGYVDRVKRVALHGVQGEHLVALVTDGAGRRMIVDLGPTQQYRGAPVLTGDDITVRGPIAWISDRKVLVAQRASVNGQMIKIRRDRAIDQRQLDRHARADDDLQVTGRIEQAKELRLRGLDRQHLVVRLKAQDDRQMLADLGLPNDLKDVALEEGRTVTVEGPAIRVNGKLLILARHVTAQGKTVQIDRDVRSVMPAMFPGGPPASKERQAAAQSPARPQESGGEIVVRGEVFKAERDGFYVVRDESGKETRLMVTPELEKGLRVGDRVTAQVKPDGTVVSLAQQDSGSPDVSQGR